jgi:hypothetical protein
MLQTHSSPRRDAASPVPPRCSYTVKQLHSQPFSYMRYPAVTLAILQLQRPSKLGLKQAGLHSLVGLVSEEECCSFPVHLGAQVKDKTD